MTTVLFVCTANICRSPYAAHALRGLLADTPGFTVMSAGVRSEWLDIVGEAACPEMPAPDGLPVLQDHSATQLTVEMVREADIIITFEAAHRAAVVDLLPRAQVKAYTARQVQRLSQAVAAEHWPPAAPERSEDALRNLNSARSWAPFDEDADVSDPHGLGVEAHRECAREIDAIVESLAAVLRT
ncbi:MAG: hypothetical protein KGP01_01165 [Actinomycetales bacterium]|nr:hypothetical protein [Actinomycetales bacterium]